MVGFEQTQLRDLLGKREIFNARALILTGDALGLAAAQMMLPLFDRRCGIFMGCRVMTSMELALYATAASLGTGEPDSPWIIAFREGSLDGSLSQALERASDLGAFTVLVTCVPEREGIASRILAVEPGRDPLLSLCAGAAGIACRIADVKRCDRPLAFPRWRDAWQAYSGQVSRSLSEQEEILERFAAGWSSCRSFESIGDGGLAGAARCAAWEILKKRGIPVGVRDGEDWCHIPFFRSRPETIGTLFFCQAASGAEGRELESIDMAERIGRRVTVITDMDIPKPSKARTLRLPTPPEGFSWLFAPFAGAAVRRAAEKIGGESHGL